MDSGYTQVLASALPPVWHFLVNFLHKPQKFPLPRTQVGTQTAPETSIYCSMPLVTHTHTCHSVT